MTDAIDTGLLDQVRASSIETREAVFEALLRELMGIAPDARSVPLHSGDGQLLGFFVRPAPLGTAPARSREEEAEYQRRLATPEEVIDAGELVRQVTEGTVVGFPAR